VILICHCLHNTGMYALLPFLHKIYVSGSKSNVKSLVTLLEYFKHDKIEKAAYLNSFKANEVPYSHFCLDINSRTLTLISPDQDEMTSLVDVNSDSHAMAESLLGELENAGKAKAVFSLICRKLKKINADDLTVELTSAKTRNPVIISLVDYLNVLTTPASSSQLPDRLLLQFHSYIIKRVHIPRCFILNKYFR
jgi:hypothetical protein